MKYPILLLIALVASAGTVWAEDPETRQPARTVNNLTYYEAFGITAARLLADDEQKQETGRRMADAIIITGVATSLLKEFVVSPRPAPNEAQRHAFPSGHTSIAFAVAASLSEREDSAKYLAFPLAAVAGWARHDVRKHTWEQVVGGAVLGTWIGHLAGEGKLRIVGHKDSDLVPTALSEHNAVANRGKRLPLWGVKF